MSLDNDGLSTEVLVATQNDTDRAEPADATLRQQAAFVQRRAQALGIPLDASPALLTILAEIPLEQRIPPALYTATADVLDLLYQLAARATERGHEPPD